MSKTKLRFTKGASRLALMLVLTACLSLLLASSAFAAAHTVTTAAELDAAFADTDPTIDITLGASFTSTAGLKAPAGKTVNLNLAGNTLTLNGTLQAAGSTLNITGPGTVTRTTADRIAVGVIADAANATALKIGTGVTIDAPNGYGVAIMPASGTNTAPNTTVDIAGTVTAKWFAVTTNGNIQDASQAPTINVASGASLTSTADTAIYAAGVATWNIDAATISGATGIYAKAGTINLNGTTVTASGANAPAAENPSGSDPTGSAIVLQTMPGYAGNATLNVTSGTITSANNAAIEEVASQADGSSTSKISISGGTFTGTPDALILSPAGLTNNAGVITGGTFSTQPAAALLGSGLEYVTNADGTITVKAPTPPSTTPTETASTTPTTTTTTTAPKGDGKKVMTTGVETGDSANILLYLAITLVAVAAMVAFVKKAQSVK